jgi:hypothetical protein
LDRTNWKLGSKDINILALAIVYQGFAFPLLFTMMPKFGNSSTSERIKPVFALIFGKADYIENINDPLIFIDRKLNEMLNKKEAETSYLPMVMLLLTLLLLVGGVFVFLSWEEIKVSLLKLTVCMQ